MNSHANFLWQVFWLMRHPKKRPSRKSSGINVFPSANTAEGAATDFDRVPFYRKNAAIKIVVIKFSKRYYRPYLKQSQPKRHFLPKTAKNAAAGQSKGQPSKRGRWIFRRRLKRRMRVKNTLSSRLVPCHCTLAVPKIFCGIRLEYFDRGASSRQDLLFSEHRFAVFLSRLSASPLPQKTAFFGVPFCSRCFAHWARFAGFALKGKYLMSR